MLGIVHYVNTLVMTKGSDKVFSKVQMDEAIVVNDLYLRLADIAVFKTNAIFATCVSARPQFSVCFVLFILD